TATRACDRDHSRLSHSVVGGEVRPGTADHVRPLKWRTPLVPASHRSFGPLPQIAERSSVVPARSGRHTLPSQNSTVPWPPTAQTWLASLPHTAVSGGNPLCASSAPKFHVLPS